MCGIAGLRLWGRSDAEALRSRAVAMADRLRHRGPDDDGAFVEDGVAFGFRRLSIIDLSAAGAQPMTSRSGRYVIEFNGEIYNAERLRAELSEPWRGHSDTEVMLAAFEAWGLDVALSRFIGMFVFALYDRETRALHIVRDRLGVKPLYYFASEREFQFASELKALDVPRVIDRGAVALYARYGYVPAPFAIYEGVRKLPPGSLITVFDDGRFDVRSYWNAAQIASSVPRFEGSEDEALARLDALLDDAVRLRMIADVPLGVFLSGGVDSSLVVAAMQRASTSPVSTFTIGFEDRRFDEAPHAARVARHLGTRHTEAYVSSREALDVVPMLGAIYDEPFGDSSAIPTLLVSRMARRDVTVALSGDGGDELFGGYHRYFLGNRNTRRVSLVPPALRKPLGRTLKLARRTRGLGEALVIDDPIAMFLQQVTMSGLSSFDPPLVPLVDRDAWPTMEHPVELMMVLDAMTYLPDDILLKVDRASMSVSLEAREPLLDHRLVEFAWSLPLSMKIRDDKGKWILRELLNRHLPPELVEREKQGFGLPVDEWLRGPLRDWAEGLLAGVEFFDRDAVRALWRERPSAIWRVLMFEAWREGSKAQRLKGSEGSAPLSL